MDAQYHQFIQFAGSCDDNWPAMRCLNREKTGSFRGTGKYLIDCLVRSQIAESYINSVALYSSGSLLDGFVYPLLSVYKGE